MTYETPPRTFVSIDAASSRLGVPKSYLKAEAQADRVPCIRLGKRFLFNIGAVERVLLARGPAAEAPTP